MDRFFRLKFVNNLLTYYITYNLLHLFVCFINDEFNSTIVVVKHTNECRF